MSRDSTGNYSSPSGDFVTNTVIDSNVMNGKLQDIGTEMTDSLSRSGKGGMLARLRGVDGTINLPAYAFTDETTLGLYRAGSGDVRMAKDGTDLQKWSTAEVRVYPAAVFEDTVEVAAGLTVTAPSNTTAITATGTGTGDGISATGGATGDGGTFSGGSTSGRGVVATSTGGSTAVVGTGGGTNAKGGEFTSTGTAAAVTATGGGTGGYGLVATGGADTAGVVAQSGTAATATTAQAALTCPNGYITFGSTVAPNSDVALSSTLTPANICKAWATIVTAAGAATLDDGFNIDSVATNGSTIDVTFATAFANTKFAPVATPDLIVTLRCTIISTTVVRIAGYKVSNDSTNGDLVDINTAPYAGQYFLHVYGRQ